MSETENREERTSPEAGGSFDLGTGEADDGLLSRIELIESQPLSHRAQKFEQVHDELLAELQRGDHGAV
ncbi:hypothetical protein GCM10009786_00040 [Leucobacter alluvii]|uniref:Uncharacterized protein n=1 Tax=Leucobacter alluvii TaxID=340321 RepID=A0ABP5MVM2_9MICO